jgi:opacity protein-like surface antigen
MGSYRTSALLGAFALILPTGAALSADMAEYLAAAPVPYEVSSNWYLRGDLGYKWYNAPDASFNFTGFGPMIDESLGDTGVVGFGFGHKWNEFFRTDVTLDYEWPGEFEGRLICPSPCTGDPDPEYSIERADITAYTGLINFYFDLPLGGEGAFGGFTPYIGAGLGTSYLVTDNVNFTNPNGTEGKWPGEGTWNFAWAAMVGGSWALNKNWLIDLNWRYVDLGNAKSGSTGPAFGNQKIHYNNISANEIRLGFRYLLN